MSKKRSLIGQRVRVQVGGKLPDKDDAIVGSDITLLISDEEEARKMGKYTQGCLVYDIDDVLRYFAKDRWKNVKHWKSYYDPAKGKVIFEVYFEDDQQVEDEEE